MTRLDGMRASYVVRPETTDYRRLAVSSLPHVRSTLRSLRPGEA
jgi:hypothetical protein